MTSNPSCAKRSSLDRYRVEQLPNGLVRVWDHAAQISGCWNRDGTPRHGDLASCKPGLLKELRRSSIKRWPNRLGWNVGPYCHVVEREYEYACATFARDGTPKRFRVFLKSSRAYRGPMSARVLYWMRADTQRAGTVVR